MDLNTYYIEQVKNKMAEELIDALTKGTEDGYLNWEESPAADIDALVKDEDTEFKIPPLAYSPAADDGYPIYTLCHNTECGMIKYIVRHKSCPDQEQYLFELAHDNILAFSSFECNFKKVDSSDGEIMKLYDLAALSFNRERVIDDPEIRMIQAALKAIAKARRI